VKQLQKYWLSLNRFSTRVSCCLLVVLSVKVLFSCGTDIMESLVERVTEAIKNGQSCFRF
jgi:hypothetical protein